MCISVYLCIYVVLINQWTCANENRYPYSIDKINSLYSAWFVVLTLLTALNVHIKACMYSRTLRNYALYMHICRIYNNNNRRMMYKMSVSIWFSIINHNFSVSCYLENILNDSLAIILYTLICLFAWLYPMAWILHKITRYYSSLAWQVKIYNFLLLKILVFHTPYV